jgi:hypothetical protein
MLFGQRQDEMVAVENLHRGLAAAPVSGSQVEVRKVVTQSAIFYPKPLVPSIVAVGSLIDLTESSIASQVSYLPGS